LSQAFRLGKVWQRRGPVITPNCAGQVPEVMVRRHIRRTKPSVCLSNEMGERNNCGSWNVATTRTAFAGAVRNASREVGQCERASVCSTARMLDLGLGGLSGAWHKPCVRLTFSCTLAYSPLFSTLLYISSLFISLFPLISLCRSAPLVSNATHPTCSCPHFYSSCPTFLSSSAS
jgi:hypothetical protein